jgi:acyl-CoA synthetase (AMP-forming)/AMP-acid ligase II
VTTVRALIERQAADRPEVLYALAADSGHGLRYAGLAQSCRRVAAALQAQGVAPGETVALVMPNGLGMLQGLLGVLWAGRCVCPVNLLAQPQQMRHVLAHSDCRLVVAAPEWADRVRGMLASIARPVALWVAEADAPELDVEPVAHAAEVIPQEDATALLMYTSGTTGQPKGVMLTQASLLANARAVAAAHALGPADRVLAVLPLYHINGFVVTMLAPLASGGSAMVAPRFSAGRFWALARGCTWLNVVPTMIAFLLEAETPPREALAGLRFCRSASSALPVAHLQAFEQRFGVGVIETMGLTETAAPSFANPLDPALRRPGSVGQAVGCEARVVDAGGHPLADGQTGEIVIRGPHVMRGYYQDAAATAAAFTPDGWLRSGDLGHRDADGFFFVTGRLKELIIKGGENIAPREIDEVLLSHPAVLEAAAVGIADPHYGQEILACVVLRPGAMADAAALRAFCEPRLGRYKTPRHVRFVAALPRGPSGKVQRLKLLDSD